jgi:membrane protein
MNKESILAFLRTIFNWKLLKETYQEWSDDKASRLAAALAYYAATAIAPLITGILAIAGLIFDTEQAQAQLQAQVSRFASPQAAEIIRTIVSNADRPQLAQVTGIISLVLLIWSASNIFAQLQDSLDTVWGVELRKDLPLLEKVKHRLLPLLVVFGMGLLLLVAIIASTFLNAAATLVTDLLPGGTFIWQILNFLLSVTILALLFGLVFKLIPDVEIAWRDVWPGAALTALLFVVGQFILGWYLGRQSGASVYGAAGSLFIFLLWLYYSAQIFLLGAEYTQVYATRYGEGVRPDEDAVGRGQNLRAKAAAAVAGKGVPVTPAQRSMGANVASAQSWRRAVAPLDNLPTSQLVVGLIDDGRALFRKELELVQTELREMVGRLARGVSLTAGGGMTAYAGVIFVLLAIALLVSQIMPLWLALLLVGILVLIEGWIITVWARHRLATVRFVPKQTLETIREDVEVVKGRLA